MGAAGGPEQRRRTQPRHRETGQRGAHDGAHAEDQKQPAADLKRGAGRGVIVGMGHDQRIHRIDRRPEDSRDRKIGPDRIGGEKDEGRIGAEPQ